MDAKAVMEAETHILSNYMIRSWCSDGLSPALTKEAEGKASRHGAGCCELKTMRSLRNAVRQTTISQVRSAVAAKTAPSSDNDMESAVAATRRIMSFTETHKMQSAPLFAGKYTEEGGW